MEGSVVGGTAARYGRTRDKTATPRRSVILGEAELEEKERPAEAMAVVAFACCTFCRPAFVGEGEGAVPRG